MGEIDDELDELNRINPQAAEEPRQKLQSVSTDLPPSTASSKKGSKKGLKLKVGLSDGGKAVKHGDKSSKMVGKSLKSKKGAFPLKSKSTTRADTNEVSISQH